jgi:hypothetical protein
VLRLSPELELGDRSRLLIAGRKAGAVGSQLT